MAESNSTRTTIGAESASNELRSMSATDSVIDIAAIRAIRKSLNRVWRLTLYPYRPEKWGDE